MDGDNVGGATSRNHRLRLAREALARAEGDSDMASLGARSVSGAGAGRSAYHLDGSIEGMLAALAQRVKPEQYVAVVGVGDVAWELAAELGIDLSHVVVIRNPGVEAARVVGNLIEGFDVVVVGELDLAPRFQRALAARARKLSSVILTMEPWPGITSPTHRVDFQSNPLRRYRRRAS